ncbi:hypothetical protein ACET3Z_023124 [Daucus carota]
MEISCFWIYNPNAAVLTEKLLDLQPKKGKPKEKEVKEKAAEKPKEKPETADDKPKGE